MMKIHIYMSYMYVDLCVENIPYGKWGMFCESVGWEWVLLDTSCIYRGGLSSPVIYAVH